MGVFERYLSVWVGLCIVAGVGFGVLAPDLFQAIAGLEYANVNLVLAVFIWVMIYPMMVNVDFASLKDVGKKPKANGYCPDCHTPAYSKLRHFVIAYPRPFGRCLFYRFIVADSMRPAAIKYGASGIHINHAKRRSGCGIINPAEAMSVKIAKSAVIFLKSGVCFLLGSMMRPITG